MDDISERIHIFHMCTSKYLVFGTKILESIFISDHQANGLLLQMLSINFFDIFHNTTTVRIMLNIKQQIQNMVLYLNKTIQ